MNGVTYADALVKARRYEEMMTESSIDEFFIEAAGYICEAAIEEDVMLDEEVNFDLIVEAVVGLMSDEQIAMENVEDFVMEASIYILNEFKKVRAKKAAEKAEKFAKRAAQSVVSTNNGEQSDSKYDTAVAALKKAKNLAKAEGDTKTIANVNKIRSDLHKVGGGTNADKEAFAKSVFAGRGRKVNPDKKEATSQVVKDKISRRAARKIEEEAKKAKVATKAAEITKSADLKVANKAKEFLPPAVSNQNTSLATIPSEGGEKAKNIAGKAADWIKANPGKAAGIGAGVAAATAGGIFAAKKIADRKKAAAKEKEEEVKENYEYPEYVELVEFVVANMTEEEIMAENASEFACEVADYMIESQMIDAKVVGDKAKETLGSKIKNAASTVGTAIKNNPGKTAAIGAGVAATGAAAAIAAKKISDKKKAAQQNQEEVKENFEYEEYEGLIEAVIGGFMSEEEIMSENATQIAIATADYIIDNIDSI